jgi:hypothetical protein
VLFWFSVMIMGQGPVQGDGKTNDMWTASTGMYTAMVLVATGEVALETLSFVRFSCFWLFSSVALWFVFSVSESLWMSLTPDMYGVTQRLMVMAPFWLGMVVLTPAVCLLPDLAVRYYQHMYRATGWDLIREREAGYGGDGSDDASAAGGMRGSRSGDMTDDDDAGGDYARSEYDDASDDDDEDDVSSRDGAGADGGATVAVRQHSLGYVPFLSGGAGAGARAREPDGGATKSKEHPDDDFFMNQADYLATAVPHDPDHDPVIDYK